MSTTANSPSVNLRDHFETSYSAFAQSANARAIPSVSDGLKPVHRRVLVSAQETAAGSFVKSALVVGNCLGRYHPHGDTSVYDALCRMSRNWLNNIVFIIPQGNFGAIDGSNAAAQRYTEAKLAQFAKDTMLEGWKSGCVPLTPTYDQKNDEPMLLPVKLPLLLLNGCPSGSIGVGFSSSIPPHNLSELCDAAAIAVDSLASNNAPAALSDIMKVMPGPDIPLGVTIGNSEEIEEMYASGEGGFTQRAVAEVKTDGPIPLIIFRSVPYGVITTDVIAELVELALGERNRANGNKRDEPKIPEILRAYDATAASGKKDDQIDVEIVIEIRKGADPHAALEKIYAMSSLQTRFSSRFVALDAGRIPRTFSLVECLHEWAKFRMETYRMATSLKLRENLDRLHIVSGLCTALESIDTVIAIIRSSKNDDEVVTKLAPLGLTTKQSEAILSMQLRRLTSLSIIDLRKEAETINALVKSLYEVLCDPTRVARLITEELAEIKRKYGGPRQSRIESIGKYDERALVKAEDVVMTLSTTGYINRQPVSGLSTQGRGGKGNRKATSSVAKGDGINAISVAHTHDSLFLATNTGAVIRTDVYHIPEGGARHIANIGLEASERVCGFLAVPVAKRQPASSVILATRCGQVKRVDMKDISSNAVKRLQVFSGRVGEEVAFFLSVPNREDSDIIMASSEGKATRFRVADLRVSQRNSGGVRGIDLSEGHSVVGVQEITGDAAVFLFVITKFGYGKRILVSEFADQSERGCKGKIVAKIREGDALARLITCREDNDILVVTKTGRTVRIEATDIPVMLRPAMGARIITIEDGDEVVSVTSVQKED